jgi:hypothetical protein
MKAMGCIRAPEAKLAKYPLSTLPALVPAFPPESSIHSLMPDVYDQGTENSCTCNAIGGGAEYVHRWKPKLMKKGPIAPGPWIMPSRNYAYFYGRRIAGLVEHDPGLSIPDGLESFRQSGYPDERYWPYDPANVDIEPPFAAPQQKTFLVAFRRLPLDLRHIKFHLRSGWPIVFGLSVDANFERYWTNTVNGINVVRKPDSPDTCLGEHAQLIVGYRDDIGSVDVRNSWGEAWGQRGYSWIPYDYVLDPNFGFDFFAIQSTDLPS